jgi:hypothetical protein
VISKYWNFRERITVNSILLKVLPIACCLLLLSSGCATMGGALIGGVSDIATSDTENLAIKNIKTLNWKTTLELVLADSAILDGDYEGFVEDKSNTSDSIKILPEYKEMVDIYDSSGVHQKFYFKGFYYQTLNNAVTPMLKLGTTADDVARSLGECREIICANGDTIYPEPILREFGKAAQPGVSVVLNNGVLVRQVPYGAILQATIVRKKRGLVTGLTYGAVIDLAYWTLVLLSLRGSDFGD